MSETRPPCALAPDFDWVPYVRAAAPVHGFHLDDPQIQATAGWLAALSALAGPLLSDAIPDRAESAPVFRA